MTSPRDDEATLTAIHAFWPQIDKANLCHVWRCTCKQFIAVQPFDADVLAAAGLRAKLQDHEKRGGS